MCAWASRARCGGAGPEVSAPRFVSLGRLRRNMDLGQGEAASSRTPGVSLEEVRCLAFLVHQASQDPSVLHKGEARAAWPQRPHLGDTQNLAVRAVARSLRTWGPSIIWHPGAGRLGKSEARGPLGWAPEAVFSPAPRQEHSLKDLRGGGRALWLRVSPGAGAAVGGGAFHNILLIGHHLYTYQSQMFSLWWPAQKLL